MPNPASPSPPTSYTTHPFTQIALSHHPSTSPTVTPVILLTISRPERQNAFSTIMCNELVSAFEMLDADDRVKAIVVTGEGKIFCAGADLIEGLNRGVGEKNKEARDTGGRVALAIHRCRKPTIAAIQGAAVGIGITMTLPMTIRLAWSSAKVGFVFSQRAVVMEAASSFFLPRLIGHSKALYLTTTGSILPASSKHFGDLFHELLPSSEAVIPAALKLSDELVAQTSTVSTYLIREMMWRGPPSAEGAHLLDSELMVQLYDKEDKEEGFRAFLEKRKPKFKGDLREGMPESVPWWETVDVRVKRDGSKL